MEDNEHESGLIKDNSNNLCARPTLALAKELFLLLVNSLNLHSLNLNSLNLNPSRRHGG